jgi:cobyrinic acid a,c-diamide synthase
MKNVSLGALSLKIPRIVIGASRSSAGKTTVSSGLIGTFIEKGLKVQPFKVGPDYIDPGYHSKIAGRRSRNLDTWLTSKESVMDIFTHAFGDAEIAVVEGVMGLYDGKDETGSGSTAEIAKILKAPIIMVVDAQKVGASIAAEVLGYQKYDPEINIAGVILNKVGSKKHETITKKAIEKATGIPVLGVLPREETIKMDERHLGLIPTQEYKTNHRFSHIVSFIKEHINLPKIFDIACNAPELIPPKKSIFSSEKDPTDSKIKVGIAFDEVFNFYYWDNIELLEANGCTVVFFSPLNDKNLPSDLDMLYIGGGFPEIFAKALQENIAIRKEIRKVAEDEMPILAECGGLMYLTRAIKDFSGKTYDMVSLVPGITIMGKKLNALGYTSYLLLKDSLFGRKGSYIKGHEFHYSYIDPKSLPDDTEYLYKVTIGKGINEQKDGIMIHNTVASYTHTHFGCKRDLVNDLIFSAQKYAKS